MATDRPGRTHTTGLIWPPVDRSCHTNPSECANYCRATHHEALQAVLAPLAYYGSPDQLQAAGTRRIAWLLKPLAQRMAERLAQEITDALAEQTVAVPGTRAAAVAIPSLARLLTEILDQRRTLEGQLSALLEAHPLSRLLISMPGIGVRTAATNLVTVGDGRTFPTADHLTSYTGLAPVTRSSGSSIRGEHAPRRGNRQLKRAMFRSAMFRDGAFYASRSLSV